MSWSAIDNWSFAGYNQRALCKGTREGNCCQVFLEIHVCDFGCKASRQIQDCPQDHVDDCLPLDYITIEDC